MIGWPSFVMARPYFDDDRSYQSGSVCHPSLFKTTAVVIPQPQYSLALAKPACLQTFLDMHIVQQQGQSQGDREIPMWDRISALDCQDICGLCHVPEKLCLNTHFNCRTVLIARSTSSVIIYHLEKSDSLSKYHRRYLCCPVPQCHDTSWHICQASIKHGNTQSIVAPQWYIAMSTKN